MDWDDVFELVLEAMDDGMDDDAIIDALIEFDVDPEQAEQLVELANEGIR